MTPIQKRTRLVALSGFVLITTIVLTLNLTISSSVRAAANGTIKYTQSGPRSLIFVNNPEVIRAANDTSIISPTSYPGDLADTGRSIYTDTLPAGSYRDFFEHFNKAPTSIGYAIRLDNPGTTSVTVTTESSAIVYGNSVAGVPIAQVLNAEANKTGQTTATIAPKTSYWLFEEDAQKNTTGKTPVGINNTGVFTGLVDFTTAGGSVTINHVAYTTTIDKVPASLTYEGYVKRYENNTGKPTCTIPPQPSPTCSNTARSYKGIAKGVTSVAATGVHFIVDDTTTGVLPVQYDLYAKQLGGAYAPVGPTTSKTGWYTNLTPGQGDNSQNPVHPVGSDMVTLVMPPPDSLTLDPLKLSDGTNNYPTEANWGVVYTVSGIILNGGQARKLTFKLTPIQDKTPIAYQKADRTWDSMLVNVGGTAVSSVAVPAGNPNAYGEATFSFSFVLALPSAGPLLQDLEIGAP